MNRMRLMGLPREHKGVWRVLCIIVVLWVFAKLAGCCIMVPRPWGPEVRGDLPDGGYIVFQSRVIGRETDDRLTWVTKDGLRRHFWVDRIHCGFGYVTLKLRDDGKGIWVESDGKVGASLDLATGEFRAEFDTQFEWAKYGQGKAIAEGLTWGILQILLP